MLTLNQQNHLCSFGLAKSSLNTQNNLVTFKYAKKVMYDYLWDKHPELLECRGHTYDATTGKLVVLPPKKTFNYLENGTWKDKPLDTVIYAYKKYNGFMACVSVYQGKVIVSTTGSTKSEYVELAKKYIFKEFPEKEIQKWGEGFTWLFEVCAKQDPHIVHENPGAYYLGGRYHETGQFVPMASQFKYYTETPTLGQILEDIKTCKHEGYMLHDKEGNICKLKSPYYSGKKLLMRANKTKVKAMFNNPLSFCEYYKLDMFKEVVSSIVKNHDENEWNDFEDQTRRNIIEIYVED